MATASDVLRIARAEVGYCRYDDPERGTKYGRWYEAEVDGPGGYDYGANGVAMGEFIDAVKEAEDGDR